MGVDLERAAFIRQPCKPLTTTVHTNGWPTRGVNSFEQHRGGKDSGDERGQLRRGGSNEFSLGFDSSLMLIS